MHDNETPETPKPIAVVNVTSQRQAMLVIHGIGEQNPYETLDSFARGVFTCIQSGQPEASLSSIEIAHADWTQVGMRISFPPPASQEGQPSGYVDLFEYYWAPETEDKLSAVETLKWLLRTDFTPLRYFAQNLQEMLGTLRLSRIRAFGKAALLFLRELGRVAFLYIPLAVTVVLLIFWLSQKHTFGAAAKTLVKGFKAYANLPDIFIALVYLLFLLMVWFGLQFLVMLKQHPDRSIRPQGEKFWFALDVIFGAAFLTVAASLDCHYHRHVASGVLSILLRNKNWELLLAAAVAAIFSYALTAYVADVAVYVNTDAKSKDYVARNAILKGSTEGLASLLSSEKYDRVILAGHSLGSVIAYDTVNELLGQINAAPGPVGSQPNPLLTLAQLQKLTGMVTFGSPLDKVYYFFRQRVKRDQAIRAQILSMLYSFRKVPSGRDYGEFKFTYSFNQLDNLVWLNAWSPMDPISAQLKFYEVNDQRSFHYYIPFLAHLSYWSDPSFYDYVCSRLL